MSNKPSWDDAPEWAEWLAMDSGGEWWWYEERPHIERHAGTWMTTKGKSKRAAWPSVQWHEAIEARPS